MAVYLWMCQEWTKALFTLCFEHVKWHVLWFIFKASKIIYYYSYLLKKLWEKLLLFFKATTRWYANTLFFNASSTGFRLSEYEMDLYVMIWFNLILAFEMGGGGRVGRRDAAWIRNFSLTHQPHRTSFIPLHDNGDIMTYFNFKFSHTISPV